MKERLKLVPPVEKVRLKELRTSGGTAYVGLEVEYHATDGEPVRRQFGLSVEDAVELGAHLVQLGEKLQATEH